MMKLLQSKLQSKLRESGRTIWMIFRNSSLFSPHYNSLVPLKTLALILKTLETVLEISPGKSGNPEYLNMVSISD